jgi:elongation factor P--(R)-beta-lysine ligase
MTHPQDKTPTQACGRLADLRPRLKQRSLVIQAIRDFFLKLGFLEVDTPVRIPSPAPEEHIEAIESEGHFLASSPELQMKRMLAAGYKNIFQVCHCFRGGERGDFHLPEFTMIEWYRLGATNDDLMRDCEKLVESAAKSISVFPIVHRDDQDIDLTPNWHRIEVADALERHAGWRPQPKMCLDRFNEDMAFKVEPALPKNKPVFLVGYPAEVASLARLDPTNPERAERFELFAGGLELANGFVELTDAKEQRRRFEEESRRRLEAGKTVYPLDERFLASLENGLPPCAGIAMGVDRLVMLLTSATSIDQVVAFPLETL